MKGWNYGAAKLSLAAVSDSYEQPGRQSELEKYSRCHGCRNGGLLYHQAGEPDARQFRFEGTGCHSFTDMGQRPSRPERDKLDPAPAHQYRRYRPGGPVPARAEARP